MIEFFLEDLSESPISNNLFVLPWFNKVCLVEGKVLGDISIVFCSDEYLINMNIEYLNHDYYTDIITFDYSVGNTVSGDLFISVDRVKDNSTGLGQLFLTELNRVLVHGLLHLCGFKDKLPSDADVMRQKEDEMLALL